MQLQQMVMGTFKIEKLCKTVLITAKLSLAAFTLSFKLCKLKLKIENTLNVNAYISQKKHMLYHKKM